MHRTILRLLTIGWTCAILFFTLTPDDGGDSFWILEIPHMDKLAHFSLFFILSLLTIRAFMGSTQKGHGHILISIIYGLALSAITECGQIFVEGRHNDLFDFLADTVGVFVGSFLAYKYSSTD